MYMLKSRTLPKHAMSNVHIQSLVSLRESKIMQLKFKLYIVSIFVFINLSCISQTLIDKM